MARVFSVLAGCVVVRMVLGRWRAALLVVEAAVRPHMVVVKAIFYVCLFCVCFCVIRSLGNHVVSKNCFGDAEHVVNINIYLSI